MFRNMSAYITSICASKKKMREQMRVTSYEYRMSFKPSEVELKLVVFYTAFFFFVFVLLVGHHVTCMGEHSCAQAVAVHGILK